MTNPKEIYAIVLIIMYSIRQTDRIKKGEEMKVLAWYVVAFLAIGTISIFSEIAIGVDVENNIWAIGVTIPVYVFITRYLIDINKKWAGVERRQFISKG